MAGLESLANAVEAVRHRNKNARRTKGNSITVTARVVSPPIPFNTADADLLYGDPNVNRERAASRARRGLANTPSRMSAFVFRGYIVATDWPQNPHKLLQNPCAMSTAEGAEIADIEDAVKWCTKFVSEEGYGGKMPKVGDWVRVRLNKIRQPGNNEGSWNTAFGDFVNMSEVEDLPAGTAQTDDPSCASLVRQFMNLPAMSLADSLSANDPGTFYWSNRKRQKTTTWNSQEFPRWNGTVLRNGEIEPGTLLKTDSETGAQLVSPALDDFKLLAAAYKAKFGKVLRVSGYRSYSSQVNVRMIRAAGDKCPGVGGDGTGNQQYNANCDFVGFAAVPGNSNHGWAAAVDIIRSDWPGYPFPGTKSSNFRVSNESPGEFRWLNKFGSRWNFVFGVRNEHWHLDWTKFGQQVGGNPATGQTAWTDGGKDDNTITIT